MSRDTQVKRCCDHPPTQTVLQLEGDPAKKLLQGQRQAGLCEFKATLVYVANSRLARAI